MFEKTSQLAEKVATSVSRRGFLGSLSRLAGTVAVGVAGMLTVASAARGEWVGVCCYYGGCCSNPKTCNVNGNKVNGVCEITGGVGGICLQTWNGCTLIFSTTKVNQNPCKC
jgi:hypothetical protein